MYPIKLQTKCIIYNNLQNYIDVNKKKNTEIIKTTGDIKFEK